MRRFFQRYRTNLVQYELENSNQNLYEQLLSSLSTTIVLVDQDLNIQYLNESAESLIQGSFNLVNGTPLFSWIGDAQGEGEGEGENESLKSACNRCLEENIRVVLPDIKLSFPAARQIKRADCRFVSANFDLMNGILIEIGIHDDGSLRSLGLARQGASQTLVRGLAHEIRNPLGGIRGAAQLLGNEISANLNESDLIQYTDVIIRETDRLSQLVGQMQASADVGEKLPINIHIILEHLKLLMESDLPHNIAINSDYDPSLPEIMGEQGQLTQGFMNILINAIEAIGDSGNSGEIILKTRIDHSVLPDYIAQQQVVKIEISDNGMGIDANLIDQVFEPMVSGKPGGTGLGLSITAEIVRNHGGIIAVKSESSQTTFSVYLKTLEGKYGE